MKARNIREERLRRENRMVIRIFILVLPVAAIIGWVIGMSFQH